MQIINTALCSFGMSGWVFHAPFIDVHHGFNLYAVYERSKNLAQEKYPGIQTYRSLEEMLADESIQLVIVNTPNATHFEFAKKALEAGKHVVIEKPFTIEIPEAEALIELAKKQNRVLSVYHNRRWDSDFLTVKKVIGQQLLGDVVEAEIHFDRYKMELSPKLHKETPGPGTGAFYDLGSHLVDQAIQLFGMPLSVFGDIAIMRSVSQVDDYFEVILYYPAKRVRLKGTYVAREPVPSYIIHGTRGSFLKSRADIQESALQSLQTPGSNNWGEEPVSEQGLVHSEQNGKIVRERVATEQGNYMHFYDQLHAAITLGQQPPVSGEDGLKVIKVIKAAIKSNIEKRVVEINS
jgi:scyllo-inositol 2-dehydrogenase (NADP+)